MIRTMKEEMEALEVKAAVRELRSLEGGYVKKIYQPNEGEILFRIYIPEQGTKMLLFKIGKALYLTEVDKDNPMKPGDYVMLMRKYTSNATIQKIEQHEFDRVVTFELQKKRKSRFIFEIFGKGNLILEGEDHILVPYRSESWSHRELKEGREYKFPPSRIQPLELDEDGFKEKLEETDKDLVRTLAVDLNLGGKYAEEICMRAGVDKNLEDLEDTADEIYSIVQKLKEQVQVEDLKPKIVKDQDGDVIDAIPFPLVQYEKNKELGMEQTESYNRALDLAFKAGDEEKKEEKEGDTKLERKLASQKRAMEDLKEEEKANKIKAELIYQNYQECEDLLQKIHEARHEGDREEIYSNIRERDDIVQLNETDEYVILELEGEKDGERYEKSIKLDFRKDVNDNAQHHYDKSKKSKQKMEGAKKAIEETKEEIEAGKKKKKKEERKKKNPTAKYWFDRYKWFISSEGHVVVAGKDTKTNEEVVKKYLEKYDRYAHADAGGAPSVVVRRGEKEEIGDKTLEEACQYAIIHSKEWKRGIAAGRAYWVKPDQVSKTAEAGESLPTGAFVIRGNRNYMDGLDMKAVLCEIEYEGEKKVMCAPSLALEGRDDDLIKKKVVFVPGSKDVNEFAKEMSEYFNVPVDEVQKVLPPGNVDVIEKG
ncbi:MAG: NFACT family protein [Candidatus Thermoplasmatota archaeon]|nr:NFACT family protein [Candidatus Thermoplasmatota archaeon]